MTHSKLAELQGIEEIVQDIKNGNTDRFEEIIEAYQQKLYAYCFRMLNHREEARDAVQDIFFKSFEICISTRSLFLLTAGYISWLIVNA